MCSGTALINTFKAGNFQQRQMVQPRRPSSRTSVMSGSHSSLISSNYMPIYPQQQPFMNQNQFRQPSLTSMNQGPEWADAMVKMEHCLAMLNSLQMNGQGQSAPSQMMLPPAQQPQPMLRQIPPFRPTVNQVQR